MLTNQAHTAQPGVAAPALRAREALSPAFTWALLAASAWFLGGLYLDGWAHSHGRTDSTFFTPWHAVFYSGFAAVALLLGLAFARNLLRGSRWLDAAPAGYELAYVGAAVFALGGVGDMVWHELFGIESGVEALLSPTHLLLATGMALVLSAPYRAARARPAAEGERAPLPALLSLALTLSLLTFMTEFAHPFVYVLAREARYGDAGEALGVASVTLQAALLSGALISALRRWRLPPGALLLVYTLNAALMSVLEDRFWVIAVAALAGGAAELLAWLLRPAAVRPLALRLFGFAAPASLYLLYFLGVMQIGRLLWSVHLWLGAVVAAGIAGLLVALVAAPPSDPTPRA